MDPREIYRMHRDIIFMFIRKLEEMLPEEPTPHLLANLGNIKRIKTAVNVIMRKVRIWPWYIPVGKTHLDEE